MQTSSAILLILSFTTACTDISTSASVSALEDPCLADKVGFKDYDAAATCAASNPGLFQVAVGAIVKAGGTCTSVDDARACTSIEPIKDDKTLGLSWWPISCTTWDCQPDPIAGLGYCKVECCISGVNGPICFKNDRVPR